MRATGLAIPSADLSVVPSVPVSEVIPADEDPMSKEVANRNFRAIQMMTSALPGSTRTRG